MASTTMGGGNRKSFWMLCLVIIACVLSFIPVYVYDGRDSDDHHNDTMLDLHLRESCMAALFVVLCPAFDAILEILSLLIPRSKEETVVDSKTHMILNITEKSIFVVGILCMSVLYPTFKHFDSESIVQLSVSFLNCSVILMVCAILCFLLRQSTTFTLWNTRIMVILVCISGTMNSCSHFYGTNKMLFRASNILFDVAALMYVICCGFSVFQSLRQFIHVKIKSSKVDDINQPNNNHKEEKSKSDKEISVEDKAIKQWVVATHMFSTFIVMTVNAVSMWYIPTFTAYQLSIVIYIMLAAAVVVFVADTFARRYLTGIALLALLNAKTDYINYISHEIRTPLSATLMGLRLILNDFKKSNPLPGSIDADRYDTLQDINSSCVASLDILNDLLCFNKLESGLLEVHKEIVNPGQFVKDSVAMFNVQARDCEVILKVVFDKPPDHDDDDDDHLSIISFGRRAARRLGSVRAMMARRSLAAGSVKSRASVGEIRPLNEQDIVSLDKFKLDQVIRNLVSNAIKFSPRGGLVTVYAYFDPLPLASSVPKPIDQPLHPVTSVLGDISNTPLGVGVQAAVKQVRGSIGSIGHTIRKRMQSSPVGSPRGSSFIASPVGGDAPHASSPPVTPTVMGKLVVVVVDNGPGISAENQKRLFKEVIQFNPEKLQAGGGSGFGLFITKSIVDLHEGTIGVYSAGEGKGTRFTLEIPMTRPIIANVISCPRLGHVDSSLSLARQALGDSSIPMGQFIAVSNSNTAHTNSLSHAATSHSRGGLRVGDSLGGQSSPGEQSSPNLVFSGQSAIRGQPTLQSYQQRRRESRGGGGGSSGGGLSVIHSDVPLSENEANEQNIASPRVPFEASLGALGGGGGGGGGDGGGSTAVVDVVRPAAVVPISSHGTIKGTIATSPSPSRNAPTRPLRGSMNKQRMGNLMLRELSRRDVLGPQSGTKSYSIKNIDKDGKGIVVGSVVHRSPNSSYGMVLSGKSDDKMNDKSGGKGGMIDGTIAVSRPTRSSFESSSLSPRLVTTLTPVKEPIEEPIIPVEVTNTPKWDILVVDDSPLNRKMLMRTLRAAGHIVEEAGDGHEGVDTVQHRVDTNRKPYDVILMDFVMPGMDGPTATKILRTKELAYTGLIIGLTGNAMPADINHFMAHGASAVMIKPIDMDLFDQTMKQLMEAQTRGK